MAHKYSGKTLAAMARFIEQSFTATQMSELFLSAAVPSDFDIGPNKLARALNVVTGLNDENTPQDQQLLTDFFGEVIKRRRSLFELSDKPDDWLAEYPEPNPITQELILALKADGYDIKESKITPLDSLEIELSEEVNLLEKRLQHADMRDVQENLDQAHQNFVQANYESCNAMLRTALEGTLFHIAVHFAGDTSKIPHKNPHHLQPADIRSYLENQNLLSSDEKRYITAFYGYASSNGSHPGMSNEAESRLRRLMTIAIIQYCLEKLAISSS